MISIWGLVLASIITSLHLYQTNKRLLALQRRVFELELERDFPGYRRRAS